MVMRHLIFCIYRIAKDDISYAVSLHHKSPLGAAGLSYDVSIEFSLDKHLNLAADSVSANQMPTSVRINTTENAHVITVFYDVLNASLHATTNVTVMTEVPVNLPEGTVLQSSVVVAWDSSPFDYPSRYSGRSEEIPTDLFPFHFTRLLNVSSDFVSSLSEYTTSAAVGEQITLVLIIDLRAEGVYDMNVTVNITDYLHPGVSTNSLFAIGLQGVRISQEGYA